MGIWRSFATKLFILLVTFVAVPVILYTQFQGADEDKNLLLLKSVQEEGRLIARSLHPYLEAFQKKSPQSVQEAIKRLGGDRTKIRLLFRPSGKSGTDTFFYVASYPVVPAALVDRERMELVEAGIFDQLRGTCEGDASLAYRYTNPAGKSEVLTSLTPVNMQSGCWVVITSQLAGDIFLSSLGQPYWKTPEIRVALVIYTAMAVIVIMMFLSIWRNLQSFQAVARNIRMRTGTESSFAEQNKIPELSSVALDFDRLVFTLRDSEEAIRQTAEENAHALKAPLAVISQSIEGIRRSLPTGDVRGRRGIELIEQSVERLDSLVSAARRIDETLAELMNPKLEKTDISALVRDICAGYADSRKDRGIDITTAIASGIFVNANEDMIETVLENLLENAISFSSAGDSIEVSLQIDSGAAVLTVEDDGPGVPEENRIRIFERYFSQRPARYGGPKPHEESEAPDDAQAGGENRSDHLGVGLWVVRRNIEFMGGTVVAGRAPGGGLRITARIPFAA
jgi:two-component system sensor histidine kinase ChvG